jgi:hypothetical protein
MKITFLILLCNYSIAQDWIRIYGEDIGLNARWVIESYDKGYVILSSASDYKYTYLLKTDINGAILWDKYYGEGNYSNIPVNIEQTMDYGYIISGTMSKYGTKDAFILKLNSCFEKEWCKVLYTNNYYDDYGRRINQLPDGGYLLLTRYYEGLEHGKRIHLHRFNSEGELLWQQSFGDSDTLIFGEDGYDLDIINDNEYLITAYCYYPDSGQSGGWVRPLLIKADSSGNTQWETIWGSTEYYYGTIYNSTFDKTMNIYTIGFHIGEDGQYPAMIKTTSDGQELFFVNLNDTAYFGQGQTVTFMEDSNIFIALGWKGIDQIWHNGFMKVDTLGSFLGYKEVVPLSNALYSTARTFDNKFITVGIHYDENSRWVIYAFKLNSDLEYDTLFTTPFIYDSLCPYEITSDTTDMDCDILVLVDDQFVPLDKVKMQIYPNPSRDKATISYPDVTHSSQREIIILNSLGIEVKHISLIKGDEETELNVSGLPAGIYFVVMMERGRRVAEGKMVVAK